MKIAFAQPAMPDSGTIVVGVLDDCTLTPSAETLDGQTGGALTRAMAASRFKGKPNEVLDVLAPSDAIDRVVLVGLGKADGLSLKSARDTGGTVAGHLGRSGAKSATFMFDTIDGAPADAGAALANLAFGARLRAYRFDKYRTREKEDQKPSLQDLTLMSSVADAAAAAFDPLDKVADGVVFTRNLVSEPANIIYPETLAQAGQTLESLGVQVEVLGEAQMKDLGMGALLGVGQGSARESQLLIMQWNGGQTGEAPIAFVGKGVTFDTGGISIKPAGGMEDMKWDMGGAGVVIGLMKALAGRKAPVNAVGIAGLVENMPSATAQRPGDIVTSMSGQTIEVINTDAEGRLVLADALWYTQDRFKPKFIIDLATLTGAIIIALGHHNAGLFSNNDELADRLAECGKEVGEAVWRLPVSEDYNKQINSDAADMKNVGGRDAGSITAAQFLQRFVNDTPWAHIDIAGVTWSKKDTPSVPKGGTGFGVQLLNELVTRYYEG